MLLVQAVRKSCVSLVKTGGVLVENRAVDNDVMLFLGGFLTTEFDTSPKSQTPRLPLVAESCRAWVKCFGILSAMRNRPTDGLKAGFLRAGTNTNR